MRIWIDLSNSPHILYFHPVIQALESQRHIVKITTRNFAQTVGLADKFGLKNEIIGGHGGKNIYKKGINVFGRSLALLIWACTQGFDLAVSHNSYSQSVAAFIAGIPSVTIMDYEYQLANHLSFRLARRVLVPEAFPDDMLRLYGARPLKVRKYPGLKEEIYLSSFKPDPMFLSDSELECEKIIVTVRPPATFALYHRFENPLFMELMNWLVRHKDVLVVYLPRTEDQKQLLQDVSCNNVFTPSQVLDGPNLLFYSDLVISAGGTMNREAAVLGTPVYTIFAGRIPAVDNYLIKTGKMIRIQDRADFTKIKIEKKVNKTIKCSAQSSLKKIVELILDVPGLDRRNR